MLKNYLRIALRNLRKHPAYTVINVVGLAVGMACCLLILLYVRDELSYDRFHANAHRVYRVVSDWGDFSLPTTNPPAAARLISDYPEIKVARLLRTSALARYEDRSFQEERIFFGTPETFDVFTLNLERGEPEKVLVEPFKVVLTEETAEKYFGDADPVGKTLLVDNAYGPALEVEVTGVAEALPANAHFHFDFLISWQTLEALVDYSNTAGYGNNSVYTYLLLPEGYAAETLEAQFPAFIERHAGEAWNGSTLSLQRLTDIHLHSHHNSELEPNSQVAYIYLFSAVALFILVIACINFMNLATARAMERSKEVGVRKVVGARRGQLVLQFLAESTLLAVLALALAVVLTAIALPGFRMLSGKAMGLHVLGDAFTLATFFAITVLVGVLAGSYPAFFLSQFKPVAVLKGGSGGGRRGVALRKGLVVFQFVTALCLIVGTLVVYRQLSYLRQASLGFDQEQVLVLPLRDETMTEQFGALQDRLLDQSGVLEVALSSEGLPGELLNSVGGVGLVGAGSMEELYQQERFVPTRSVSVGFGFFEALGVDMVAGRAFSEDFPSDSGAFVLNETAARLLQQKFPEQLPSLDAAVGKEIMAGGELKGTLIGITEDFNMSSLHEALEPILYFIEPDWYGYVLVRLGPDDITRTVETVRAQWETLFPGWPFEYSFADQAFDAQYRTEERLGRIFTIFALLAVFIACLGLFGLASFTAQQRTKEIGVRKVLGASVTSIVGLLTKDFARLVAIAFVLAVPLAYFGMDWWLADFAYHIDIPWWVFAASGLAALLVALGTVGYQALRAALTDPVKSLRYE